jgi:hypothetical protein
MPAIPVQQQLNQILQQLDQMGQQLNNIQAGYYYMPHFIQAPVLHVADIMLSIDRIFCPCGFKMQ